MIDQRPSLRARAPWGAAMAFPISAMMLLAACSNGKEANEANFRKALAPLVSNKFCRPINVARVSLTEYDGSLPPTFPIIVQVTPTLYGDDKSERAMLAGAVQQGLLDRKESTVPAREAMRKDPLQPTAVITYQPTDKGKAFFRELESSKGNYLAACMGTGHIDKIVRWTDPADALGQTVSQVTYTYSATDLPSIVPANIREQAAKPIEAKAMLVRTSDGWHVAD